jgi:hypothetical protein
MRRPYTERARRTLPWLAVTAVLGFALRGHAEASDPRVAFRAPTAVTEGLDVSDRLDASGGNYSRVLLPKSATVAFQVRLAPPIVGELTAAGDGGVLVAHGRERVSLLDATGRSLWSVRFGAELASGAVPFGAGRYLLVARDGRLFELSSTGVVSERERLPWNDVDGRVLYAPTSEGGAILANGTHLARVGPASARGFATGLKSPLRTVFDWRGTTLAMSSDGSIWTRGTAGDPRQLTTFGAPLVAALLQGDRLFGATQHELLAVDLPTKRASVVWAEPALELRDVASAGGEKLRILAGRALVVDLDTNGRELGRFTLGSGETGAEIASLVSDASGASLVVMTGSPLVSLTPEGDATSITGSGCPDPLRLTPVGRNRLVAACRSGLVRGLSDKAR